MRSKLLVLSVILLYSLSVFSQAGVGVYRFLDLPVSSRMAAIGGYNVSLRDNDLNFAFLNPSLLTAETDGVIGLNFSSYLADIKFGTAMYGHNFGDKNYAAIGVQYVDLGKFDGRDETDNPTGTFTAKDMALYVLYARPLTNHFTVGGTFKPIFSAYESYTSVGVAMDAGISYKDNIGLFSAGLVFRNLGFQLKSYRTDEDGQHREPLPIDVQLGGSLKLLHAPFRVSLTLNNLNRWDLSYQSTNQSQTNLDGTTEQNKISFVDMTFRHTVFGVEFVPSNNFYLAAGYNHRRHKEMMIEGYRSLAGFSFGGGLKLYKFHVGFGMTQFQVGNYAYQFSISTSLSEFSGI